MFLQVLLFPLIFGNFDVNTRATAYAVTSTHGWESVFANNLSSVIPLVTYGDKSYFFAFHMRLRWHEALNFCKNIHMELVSVNSLEENEKLHKHIQNANKGDNYWTAGSRVLDGSRWIWMSTGIPIDFTHWRIGQPDSRDDGEQCLELWYFRNEGLFWNDRGCDVQFHFICERDNKKQILESKQSTNYQGQVIENSRVKPNTLQPLISMSGTNYYLSTDLKLPHGQAMEFCREHLMNLVSIPSREKNVDVFKLMQKSINEPYWTSGRKETGSFKEIWRWTTGEKITYFNWRFGEHENPGGNEDCIEINKSGDWNDESCLVERHFICEKSVDKNEPDRPENDKTPVINVYISNNVVSQEKNFSDIKDIISSKTESGKLTGFTVQVVNNIDANDNGKRSSDANRMYPIHLRPLE